MPQMGPMLWMNLFFFFSIIFIMLNSMNFFMFNYSIKKKLIEYKKKSTQWKW
uniref:ATP synthase complex subunit 8 n=1 Tax=Chorotypus fenestratus TaxID=1564101 RepID=A0A0N7AS28_9ORTH|nr:ATP synthase F0 subunit 8 [Chorotypus fenestratus]